MDGFPLGVVEPEAESVAVGGCGPWNLALNLFIELGELCVGPLVKLVKGATTEHVERWSLHKNITIKAWTDSELDRVLLPRIK